MSSSLQEREKLRKQIKKLFEKQEKFKNPAGDKAKNKILHDPDKNDGTKKTLDKQVKKNNSKSNQVTSVSNKISKKKNLPPPKTASQQNGYVKTTNKKNSNKSEGSKVKKDKQKYTKVVQKELNSPAVKSKEKFSANQSHPMKTQTQYKPQNNNTMENQVKKNSKLKKSENEIEANKKDQNKTKKPDFANQSRKPLLNCDPKSKTKEKQSDTNNQVNLKKNQKLTPKKRAAETSNSELLISEKKQKLSKNAEKKTKFPIKVTQKQKNRDDKVNKPFPQFDLNGMTGHVHGGEIDSDYEDYLANNYEESEYSSGSMSEEENNTIQKFMKNTRDHSDSSGDEEEYYDSEDDYYSESDEEEEGEEEENYSDFDENDYEEEEDSCNYFTDNDDYSSNYSYDCNKSSLDFDCSDSDEDYKMPKDIPEDLIIHRGTATKRDLVAEDNVTFNSETGCQIIELEVQQTVKVIHQPKACEREELLKLKFEEKPLKPATLCEPQECPKLVPILDEDGFQRYIPSDESGQEEHEQQSMDDSMDDVSLGSEYTEVHSDDDDYLSSDDINEKYLNRNYDDDGKKDDGIWSKTHKVDVIDATHCKYENNVHNLNDDSNSISLTDDIKQITSFQLYENINLKTECNILSTEIIDKETFAPTPNDNSDQYDGTTTSERNVLEDPESDLSKDGGVNELHMEKETGTPQSLKVSKTYAQKLLGYNTKFFNAFNSNLVLVLLKDPFYIYGTVRLTLLAGTMEVYGHSLALNSEVEIFSPKGCSVIEITSSKASSGASKENLKEILKSYEQQFALNDLKQILKFYDCGTDAVVLLRRNERRKKIAQQFKKFMSENVFPNINNINVDRPLYNSEYILRCMINTSTREQSCLHLPEQWQQFSITPKSRVMLVGGKGVGKSTLLRYLINRHLPQKVLLIDLDIGQPEVFVPQTISCAVIRQPLLGPGFLLNMQPDMAYAVGHTNISLCAHKYMDAVRCLIAYCKGQDEYKEIPWLINTMGYNKGFGLELISVIAREMSLSDVIQLQSNKDINNFDSILHPPVLSSAPHVLFPEEGGDEESLKETLNYRLHVWQSAIEQKSRYQKEWSMSAKDFRFVIFLARLSEALQGHADWLTDLKPFSASLNDLKIVNLIDSASSLSEEQLAKAVEANLVYLCHYEKDLKPLKCIGIGVVRAIDFHVQQLYLIPALPYALLRDVNCIAIGEFTLSTSIFTNQGSRVKNIAPFVYNTISANASKAIKQIYHRPQKFLTGKHKKTLN